MRTLIARIHRRLAEERGAVLVIGIGVSFVLGIAGTTMMEYTSSNLRGAYRSRADQTAYALAESGLNNAMSILGNPANDPTQANLLPAQTTNDATGSVTWWGTFDSASSVWTVYSRGSSPAPAPNPPVTRLISAHVRVSSSGYTAPQPNRTWDYLYATRSGYTCDENVASNVTVGMPIYTNGTLCISAGGVVTGAVGVRKTLTLSGTASIVGSTSSPVPSASVAQGCKYYTNALHTPCSTADNVFARTYDTNVPIYTPPTVAWDTWYADAAPGPAHPCTTSSGVVPTFDSDTVRNNSLATPFSLTPAASYSCRSGTGEISWDASSRTLTINGTVFVDGSVKIDNALVNTFAGQGTLYLSGTMLVSANTKLCAKVAANGTDCDMAGWDPAQAMLVVVANGNGGQITAGYGAQISNGAGWQGGLYTTNGISIGSSAQVKGPLIATTVVFGSYSQTYPYGSLATMPSGSPGAAAPRAQVSPPQDITG